MNGSLHPQNNETMPAQQQMISKCVDLMDKRDSLNPEAQRMNVLCKGSVKKLALGQCVRNQASQHWEQSVGQRGLGKGREGEQ